MNEQQERIRRIISEVLEASGVADDDKSLDLNSASDDAVALMRTAGERMRFAGKMIAVIEFMMTRKPDNHATHYDLVESLDEHIQDTVSIINTVRAMALDVTRDE